MAYLRVPVIARHLVLFGSPVGLTILAVGIEMSHFVLTVH